MIGSRWLAATQRAALGVLAFAALSTAAGTASALSPITRQEIIKTGQIATGFSYWWGKGRFSTANVFRGTCSGNCGSCTHSGDYGGDCSGLVAKAWQVPGPIPIDTPGHPYSTSHFRYSPQGWAIIDRSQVKTGDAYVYNTGGGHIFIYESGDPHGSPWAYECAGCSTGCVHRVRSSNGSPYVPIRRDATTDMSCQPHCEGSVMVDSSCGKGDCGVFGASCANDALGLRCVAFGCPAVGKKTSCRDGRYLQTCSNGGFQEGDCAAFGAKCEEENGVGKCVSAICPPTGKKTGCIDESKILTCENGKASTGDCGVFGAICGDVNGVDACIAPYAAKLVATTSTGEKTGPGAFEACAGAPVEVSFELENEGYIPWYDGDAGPHPVGRNVRLGTSEGEGKDRDFSDPLAHVGRISLLLNANNKNVAYKGKDCNDAPGCRRTIFTVKGKAPKTGKVNLSWQLVDEKKAWFGPVVTASVTAKTCAASGGMGGAGGGTDEPFEEEEGNDDAGGSAGAGGGGAVDAGGASAVAGAAGSLGTAGASTSAGGASTVGGAGGAAGIAGDKGPSRPRSTEPGTEDAGGCSATGPRAPSLPNGLALGVMAAAALVAARRRAR